MSLHITPYSRSGEIGDRIDGGYEGRGLASRAVAAVLDHAFGALGIERVSLHTEPANQRSRALARRLGFVEEGLLRQGLAFPDGRRDEVVYGLLASEWRDASASAPDRRRAVRPRRAGSRRSGCGPARDSPDGRPRHRRLHGLPRSWRRGGRIRARFSAA